MTTSTKEYQLLRMLEKQGQRIDELERKMTIMEVHLAPKTSGQILQYFTIEDFEGFISEQLCISALQIINRPIFSHIKIMR